MTEFLSPRARHRLSERYHELLRECGELHDAKQADYGEDDDPFANVRASDDFGVPGWIGAILRGNDKMKRIQKAARQRLTRKEIRLKNESMENSLLDLAVYALIALVLFEEEQGLLPENSPTSPGERYVWDTDDMPIPMAHCEALLEVITNLRRSHYRGYDGDDTDIKTISVSPDIVLPTHRTRFFASASRMPVTLFGVPLAFDERLSADEIQVRHTAKGWAGLGVYVTEFGFSDFIPETP